jgi:hypothetical protein
LPQLRSTFLLRFLLFCYFTCGFPRWRELTRVAPVVFMRRAFATSGARKARPSGGVIERSSSSQRKGSMPCAALP